MYCMYVYVSVRYSLLDDTECRGPVYCIAHTMSNRSISPVGIQYAVTIVSFPGTVNRYILPMLLAVYII